MNKNNNRNTGGSGNIRDKNANNVMDESVVLRISQVEERIKIYRERVRYFIYGLLSLFIIMVGVGLLDKGELFRIIHEKIFPSISHNMVAISYESLIELRVDDPRRNSGSMSFYAKPGERVMLYAYFKHRFYGEKDKRKVVVLIDKNTIFEKPTENWTGRFENITDKLDWNLKSEGHTRVHQVVFQLDETQPLELTGEVDIVCVVLVYGAID